MRNLLASRTTAVTLLLVWGLPRLAAAQNTSSTETPPASSPTTANAQPAAAAATPAAATAGPTEASATATAAPTSTGATAPVPAEPAEAEKPVPSYFRLDHDYMFGLQLWAGATYPLTESLGLATDIYVAENYPAVDSETGGAVQSWWGEFDIGPALTLGPLTVTPMAGIAFDWAAKRAVALNAPQLYTVVSLDKFYFESWIWTVLYSPFKDPVYNNYFHTRNWALYKLSSNIGVGPQFEFTYLLNDKVAAKGVSAMPLGAHVELSYGTGNSLGLFLGYELDKDVRDSVGGNGAEGRLTFVHNF